MAIVRHIRASLGASSFSHLHVESSLLQLVTFLNTFQQNPFSFSILYLNNHFLSSNFPSLQSASQFHPTNHINTNTKTPTTNQSGHPLAPQPTETPKPTKSTPTNTQNSTTPMQKLQQQINWPPTNTTTTHRNTQTSKINTYKHSKPINM